MPRLTVRERRLLRDRVARTAIRRRLANPLVTKAEREDEKLDLIPVILEHYVKDPKAWSRKAQYFTRGTQIVEAPDEDDSTS